MKIFSCFDYPAVIEGLVSPKAGKMYRLPDSVIDKINGEAGRLAKCPAGGCVRFCTDAENVKFTAKIKEHPYFSHNTPLNVMGISVFTDGGYYGAFAPSDAKGLIYSHRIEKKPEMQEVRLELPLYAELESIELEVPDTAALEVPSKHTVEKPVLFYGSSITHGACASHPGMAYPSILARELDFPLINLGFSGSALAEKELAGYIGSLELSAFVFDYDFNAPNAEYLRDTHGAFFRIIREKQPELPVLMMSRPSRIGDSDTPARRGVIYDTYKSASDSGDKNVAFIDGASFFEAYDRGLCTVDLTHPTDLGFYLMAKRISPILRELLYKNN